MSESVGVDGADLVLGLVIGEFGAEFLVKPLGRRQFRRRMQHAGGGDFYQPLRHLADAQFQAGFPLAPGGMAEPVERNFRVFRAIARQKLDILDRQEKLVAAGIMQLQAIVRRARRLDMFQADETADAVIDMDDKVARRKRRDLGEEIFGPFPAPALGRETVAENILLADDREIAGDKAGLQPDHGESDAGVAQAHGVAERGNELLLFQPMFGENRAEALARAVGPAGDDDFLALALQGADMVDRRLKDIGVFVIALWREIAPRRAAAVDDFDRALGRRERRETRRRSLGQRLRELLLRHVKLVRRQRLVIAAGRVARENAAARFVIILDLRETLMGGGFGLGVEQQRRVIEVLEQRVEAWVEQRQPMFEALRAAALAHRFVERIAARLGAEMGDIALAETLDRLGANLRLVDRHEIERAQLRGRALAFRVEGADRLQHVAEKVEPHRAGQARRIKIDNAAAQGVFAALANRRSARKTVGVEPGGQLMRIDRSAWRGGKAGGGHVLARRQALGQGGDGGEQNARLFQRGARARKTRQSGHALGGYGGIGRDAVIGLAVPGREFQDFRVRRGESQGLAEGAQAPAVARDMDQRTGAPLARLRHGAGEIGGDKGVKTLRRPRENERTAFFEFGGGAEEVVHVSKGM